LKDGGGSTLKVGVGLWRVLFVAGGTFRQPEESINQYGQGQMILARWVCVLGDGYCWGPIRDCGKRCGHVIQVSVLIRALAGWYFAGVLVAATVM